MGTLADNENTTQPIPACLVKNHTSGLIFYLLLSKDSANKRKLFTGFPSLSYFIQSKKVGPDTEMND